MQGRDREAGTGATVGTVTNGDAGTGATVGTGTNSQTRELSVVLADFKVVSKAVTALYRQYKAVTITDTHTH